MKFRMTMAIELFIDEKAMDDENNFDFDEAVTNDQLAISDVDMHVIIVDTGEELDLGMDNGGNTELLTILTNALKEKAGAK